MTLRKVSLRLTNSNGSGSAFPVRMYASMAWAALRPAAIASTAVAAPVTTSPPEKTPSTLVSKVLSLTWIVCQRVRFKTSPNGRKFGTWPSTSSWTFVPWPIAAMTKSQSTTNSLPRTGLGLRRPLASGSPSSIRRHSRPVDPLVLA